MPDDMQPEREGAGFKCFIIATEGLVQNSALGAYGCGLVQGVRPED